MKIDIYTHIIPKRYLDTVYKYLPEDRRHIYESVRTLWNINERLQIMDEYGGLVQVLTPSGPPLELITQPEEASELAMLYNDEIAELVAKYPDRFVAAVACLPMNNIDAALEETRRAIVELGFKGVFIQCPIYNGSPAKTKPMDLPELMPLYEMMSDYDLPIWVHPFSVSSMADYTTEEGSKYGIYHVFGWPYETTATMTRLVFSGILERYPNLKIITHHCGALVPYFADRITGIYEYYEITLKAEMPNLSRPPIEYFRMFYNDTALYGNTPALMCAHAFFGTEHLLFGTDMPYGIEQGSKYTRDTIHAIERMDIPDSEKQKIFGDNAKALLNLK